MKKGFTLIELLAVIVILAVIALIATPIVLNIIEDVKEESNQRSIELYAEAVRNAIANYELENKVKLPPEEFSEILEGMDYNGSRVVCDTKELYDDYTFYLGKCSINDSEKKYSYGKPKYKTYQNGEIVYFDVSTGKRCNKDTNFYHEDNSKTGYTYSIDSEGNNSTKTTDNQNSCLKFYAFNDDGSDKINLILDHNTTSTVHWTNSNTSSNSKGPIDVINYLYNDTRDWIGTITPQNYQYNGSPRPYIIDYSGYKARLIEAQEIAKITGADKALKWNEILTSSYKYYLDGEKGHDTKWQTQIANSTNQSEYYWLFDRTDNCIQSGCKVSDSSNYGYWTSSASVMMIDYAWFVHKEGCIDTYRTNLLKTNGVRPVIEVLKSKLN